MAAFHPTHAGSESEDRGDISAAASLGACWRKAERTSSHSSMLSDNQQANQQQKRPVNDHINSEPASQV
jgi:hypothetical protein